MRAGDKHLLHVIFVFRLMRRDSHTAPMLRFVFRNGQALDIPGVRKRNHDVFAIDQIFVFDRAEVHGNFRLSRRRIFILDFRKIVSDDRHHAAFVIQNIFQIENRGFQSGKFFFEFFHFERGETLQAHFEDRIRLLFVERERRRKFFHRHVLIRGFLDHPDHFIDIRKRKNKPFHDMRAFFRFIQFKPRTTGDDFFLVFEVAGKDLSQIQRFGLGAVFHERKHDQTVGYLQIRLFIQRV